MIFAKIPAINGVPETTLRILKAVSLSDTLVAAYIDTDQPEEDWEVITEEEWKSIAIFTDLPDKSDPRDEKIYELEQNQRIMQETINFLLGI